MDEPGKVEQRRRAVLGGLDDEGAAGGQRRADLHGGEEELAVPGHDGGDDADRLAPDPDLHVGLVDRQMGALDLVGEARIIAVVVGDIGDLRRGLADDLAGVAGLDLGQSRRDRRDEVGEAVEQLAALRRRHPGQGPPREGADAPLDGTIDVAPHGLGHVGPGCAGRRIEAFESGPRHSSKRPSM